MSRSGVTAVADLPRNLVHVAFLGTVLADAWRAEGDCVADAVAQLKPGFTTLVDLTDLESMDLDCASLVARMMDRCLAARVGLVVRIIPDPEKDIGFNILSITHYRGRVPIVTCASRAEAEAAVRAK